ncbi:MAG: alanine--tRNA ligase, partial [Myxococcales bacterium]|nr:alanine--tRNA ligase [Myxococcales bacterium]
VGKIEELHRAEDFTAFCVIADHVRTLTFSLADGGMFSNEGRGYVLRRILRRAVRFGRLLGFDAPFLCHISPTLAEHFGDAYPEVRATVQEISEMIRLEEERFFRTIDRGIARFEDLAAATVAAGSKQIEGEEAFKLYDTFGFPLDLTQIMAEEQGLTVDLAGFDAALKVQQDRARSHDKRYEGDAGEWIHVHDGVADKTVAWQTTHHETKILRLREHSETGVWEILLQSTPFYAESGGQVGDTGTISESEGRFVFKVTDTQKTPSGITHLAKLESGTPNLGLLKGQVLAEVDEARRFLVTCNHTATHLLHAALHDVVSDQAFQAGSLVAPERLRFDFSY